MSKFMRDFFRWLCCCCSNRQNGGINNPVIEMQDLRKPDILPDEQQAGASRFKIVTVRRSQSDNIGSGSRPYELRQDFYRPVGRGRRGRRSPIPQRLAGMRTYYSTDL